ncbi:SWIM zinc finger family protein [Bdellovibrionota bacterium FG-2]
MSSHRLKKTLIDVISRAELRLLAGDPSFQRGEKYFNNGSVAVLTMEPDLVMATVQGTKPYRCKLWMIADVLQKECTCLAFYNADFCKHLVAVGLALLEPKLDTRAITKHSGIGASRDQARPKRMISVDEIRKHLSKFGHDPDLLETLINKIMSTSSLFQLIQLQIHDEKRTAKSKVPRKKFRPPGGQSR